MALSLRRTNFRSPADAHRQDYLVMEDRQVIGRIYEERYVPADVKWFWSITEYVDPALGIRTHGRVGSLPVAMEQFKLSWSKVRETSKEQRPADIREVQAKIARELAAMSEVPPISCANFIGGRSNAPCHTASMFQR
jgi:hypothetical protein